MAIETRVWFEGPLSLVQEAQRFEAKRRHAALQPPLTLEAWRRRREEVRDAIRAHAGLSDRPCPLDPQEHGRVQRRGYHLRKLTYQSRPGLRVTANLYVPDGEGPFPAVLNVHGHWSQGKIADRVSARGRTLAADGFVCLTVDAFGAGERGTRPGEYEYHGAGLGASLLNIGESLLGMQIQDNMRALDLLQSLPFVRPDRLGVTGASGGGNQTMWVTAMDDRVKASVPVVSVGTFESYVGRRNCICEVLPGGLRFMEEWTALALAAPQPMLILNSLQDTPTFCVQEMIRSFLAARHVYGLYGAADRIAYQAIDLPHGYWPEMRSCMLGWFRRWLRDEGEGRPAPLPEIEPLSEEECLCFPDRNRPVSVPSILEFALPRAEGLARRHLGDDVLDAGRKRDALRELLGLPAGDPGGEVTDLGETRRDGCRVRKLVVESEPGVPLPVTILAPGGKPARRVVLAVHPEGKESVAEQPWVRNYVEHGGTAALVDLRGTGETRWDTTPVSDQSFHDLARACLWLGRTLVGDWTFDLLALARVLRTHLEGPLHLVAFRETGLAGLCASALGGGFSHVTTCESLGSYVPDSRTIRQSMAVHVPGVLAWGNVSMMATLADAETCLLCPTDWAGEPYPPERVSALAAEIAGLRARLGGEKPIQVVQGSVEDHLR